MAYTVKKLAQISGVSVRTLHFYDEVGLLRPAYHGANGYRYYEEPQLLALQQILFFRELGFELKQIKKILNRNDFDRLVALNAHKQVLEKELLRIRKLIKTIDKTTEHLKGTKKMKTPEMYHGFNEKKQEEYENYLIHRFGDKVKNSIEECNQKMKNWNQQDLEKSQKEYDQILKDLAKLWENQASVESSEVQKVIRRHYEWLKGYWTPDRDSYAGLGEGYTGFEWKKPFEPYDSEHPKLAQFLAEGMKIFSMKELS